MPLGCTHVQQLSLKVCVVDMLISSYTRSVLFKTCYYKCRCGFVSNFELSLQHLSYKTFSGTWTYPDLFGRRSRVRFPCRLSPGRWSSPADWAGAQSHVVGVLPPFPRVDHEFAKTRACRRQGLRFPGLDRRGFDDRHQNPFGRVVAENNVRVLVICHYRL